MLIESIITDMLQDSKKDSAACFILMKNKKSSSDRIFSFYAKDKEKSWMDR